MHLQIIPAWPTRLVRSPAQARLQNRPDNLNHALAVVDVQPHGPLERTAVHEGTSPDAVVEDRLPENLLVAHVDGWLPQLSNGIGVMLAAVLFNLPACNTTNEREY